MAFLKIPASIQLPVMALMEKTLERLIDWQRNLLNAIDARDREISSWINGLSVTESELTLSDNTTGNVSTSKHGFAPKAPNDTTKFLRGDASWAAPGGIFMRSDPSVVDFDETDFTEVATWTDLDLSSIVPSGAKAVILRVRINHTSIPANLAIRKNGNTYGVNAGRVYAQVASVQNEGQFIVEVDSSRYVEYNQSVDIATVDVVVIGWFI